MTTRNVKTVFLTKPVVVLSTPVFLPVIGLDDVMHHMAVTEFSKGRGLREVTPEVTNGIVVYSLTVTRRWQSSTIL